MMLGGKGIQLSRVGDSVRKKKQTSGNLEICLQVKEMTVLLSSGSCLPYKSQFTNPSVLIIAI